MIRPRMNRWIYTFGWHFARYTTRQCVDLRLLNGQRLERPGPFLIACTHVSHLEPFVLSPQIRRPIHWLSRTEHYRFAPIARMLDWCGAIPIRRDKPSVRAIRTSIDKLREGRIVGIFPEGGVMKGPRAAFRGGSIKRGVCTIALRAGVPIVPVVMLGTDRLNAIEPWYPGRLSKVWGWVGDDINACEFISQGDRAIRRPPLSALRRARLTMSQSLTRSYVEGYQTLIEHYQLDPRRVP